MTDLAALVVAALVYFALFFGTAYGAERWRWPIVILPLLWLAATVYTLLS